MDKNHTMRAIILSSIFALLSTSAFALDLPGRAPAKPQDERNPCAVHGPGFVRAPGTATCVKIGGFVRGQYQIRKGSALPR